MIVLIDIDNTFWQFAETLLPELNKTYGTEYKFQDINCYDWFEKTFDNPWPITETKEFWDKVQPYDNAVKIIEDLVKEGHTVKFVSASWFTPILYYKIQHLVSFFDSGIINDSNIIIAKDKNLIDGDIFIDDSMSNLLGYAWTKIRYVQPWNHGDIRIEYSANGWRSIKSLIDYLAR